jgi:hypothetical protein
MEKSEFTRLPSTVVLGILYDILHEELELTPVPELPRAAMMPKYDTRCRTKGGTVYASECDLGQLQYYFDRASRGTDPKYAEKNAKEAKALGFFIAWREQNPMALWSGERYMQGVVTAAAPTARPRVTEWEPRGEEPKSEPLRSNYDDDDSFLFGAGK